MDEISFDSGETLRRLAFRGERRCVRRLRGRAVRGDGTRVRGHSRHQRLVDYARGFAAAGLDVVLFDYRGFGGSGGSPRQLVSASRQRRDYHAAIAAARRLPGVDPERIVLWGISYSGGHVVRVAAEDGRVAAVVR